MASPRSDPSGALNFNGKAVLHATGVNFSNGASYAINMGEMQLDEELGKGNYGTVKKVLHKPTNVLMAMKVRMPSTALTCMHLTCCQEIRLELDEAKLNAIIMELDILHRAVAPEIVEFYGAFFIETCVYYCMEYMDAGSLDKIQAAGVPEDVLGRIAGSMVRGLKFLKDELQIIHRGMLHGVHACLINVSHFFFQMLSQPMYSSTERDRSSCAISGHLANWKSLLPRPTLAARVIWL